MKETNRGKFRLDNLPLQHLRMLPRYTITQDALWTALQKFFQQAFWFHGLFQKFSRTKYHKVFLYCTWKCEVTSFPNSLGDHNISWFLQVRCKIHILETVTFLYSTITTFIINVLIQIHFGAPSDKPKHKTWNIRIAKVFHSVDSRSISSLVTPVVHFHVYD